MELTIFYLLSGILVGSCLLVVFLRNPVYNLLGLLSCFFTLSGIFMMLGAEFLALIVLLIYASSLIICFVFVLMGTDFTHRNSKTISKAAILGIIVLIAEIIAIVIFKHDTQSKTFSSDLLAIDWTKQLSIGLFNDYAYPTVILSFIMISGMITVVLITNEKFKTSKGKKSKLYSKTEAIELKKVKFKEGIKDD